MPEDAFSIGERAGSRFRESVETQLEAIAAKYGVRTASLAEGPYSSGPASTFSRGGGISKRGAGQRGGRRTGGGDHAAPERAYHGEPVLDEGTAADTDAAKAIREGFKNAQDSESHIPHGKGTEAEALSDTARDPNAARAAAVQAARDADDGFTGTASTYNPNKPGWKSGGQETASGERYSDTAYTAAIQQQLAHQFWPEGKMGYGKNYQPRYFEAEDPKTGKRVILKRMT